MMEHVKRELRSFNSSKGKSGKEGSIATTTDTKAIAKSARSGSVIEGAEWWRSSRPYLEIKTLLTATSGKDDRHPHRERCRAFCFHEATGGHGGTFGI